MHNAGSAVACTIAEQIKERYGERGQWWREGRDDVAGKIAELSDTDLVIVAGGDGTILKCAQLFAPLQVPIVAVNAGTVGFLAEIATAKDAIEQLAPFVDGRFKVRKHAMLLVRAAGDEHVALNECWIHRGQFPRVLTAKLELDGELFNSYRGDGLLVATPTGSTGYAYSLGGPILDVDSRALLVQPIACERPTDGSLVVADHSRIVLRLAECDSSVHLYVDGAEKGVLERDDEVGITVAEHAALFAYADEPNRRWGALARKLRPRPTDEGAG